MTNLIRWAFLVDRDYENVSARSYKKLGPLVAIMFGSLCLFQLVLYRNLQTFGIGIATLVAWILLWRTLFLRVAKMNNWR